MAASGGPRQLPAARCVPTWTYHSKGAFECIRGGGVRFVKFQKSSLPEYLDEAP